MSATAADESASYAAEVARLMWPEPWGAPFVTRSGHRDGEHHRDAYLFPSGRRPRMLVPADVPGSSTMLQRLGNGRATLAAPLRRLLERSVHSRAFALAHWPMLRVPATDPGADSIERHLAHCLGSEVRVGVMLGTRRVNQKPVLQIFGLDGSLLGFAKVGHNDLTAELVRQEASALAAVGAHQPRSFRIPQRLDHGSWNGMEVLVISALRTHPRERVTEARRMAAMREIAHLDGSTCQTLADSAFWSRLTRTAQLLSEQPDGPRLLAAVAATEQRDGGREVSLGGWHGDWGRWNMGIGGGTLQIWDWERYDPQVPIGFDAIHFAAQSVRPGARGAPEQEAAFLRGVPDALDQLEVDADQHDVTLRLYLLEIAVRYVAALTHGETPALRRRTSWVLSLLERLSEHSTASASRGRP